MSKKIGVFVAWPYANGALHLGHLAGAYIPADIFARYHRLRGNDVLMVSGSDSHGTPITLKAREENSTPLEVVHRYHKTFLDIFQQLGISFDLFTLTHTKNHQTWSQEFFKKLHANGDLSVKTEEQYYDESMQMFLPDSYVKGTCPKCNYLRAKGDQCENCGTTFEGPQLVDPISTLSKTTPVVRASEHFYFEMAKYQTALKDYLQGYDHFRPAVLNQTLAMIEDGLKPRPITRDIEWGIQVPIPGWEKKVMYVWFDAVIGYLSGSVEWAMRHGNPDAWRDWWYNKESKSYYFIGKDNITFHSVIWPVELMAYDTNLSLPFDVPANQFLNINDEKLSTSRGLAVWAKDALEKVCPDALRFYITSILPETKDANFSWEELKLRNNGELVAAWGNLVNRTIGFTKTKFENTIPIPKDLAEQDLEMLRKIEEALLAVGKAYEEVRLRDALKECLNLTREANRYIDERAPWTAIKTDRQKAGNAIFVTFKVIDTLKIMFAPILPFSSQSICGFFKQDLKLFGDSIIGQNEAEGYEVLEYVATTNVDLWKISELKGGEILAETTPLFKNIE